MQVNFLMMIDSFFATRKKFQVLVIGDVMIDSYIRGTVSRISPEAPVPILDVNLREYRLGGAANVALNLQKLGAQPFLCAVVGADSHGDDFFNLLEKESLSTSGICRSVERKTTIKHRIIGNRNQMLRVDEEDTFPLSAIENEQFLAKIEHIFQTQNIAAVVFEDYDKGLLSQANIMQIVQWAQQKNVVVTVDPKRCNFYHYNGVTLFKPNYKEFCDALELKMDGFSLEELQKKAKDFAVNHKIQKLLVTLSDKGLLLYDSLLDTSVYIPAQLIKVSDVSGAGDTVIATATLGLLANLDCQELAWLSNLAGSIVCQFPGVVPLDIHVLKDEVSKSDCQTIKKEQTR